MVRVIALIWTLCAGAVMAQDVPDGMRDAQVIILGEVHDNAAIHARQAELIAALAPKAVVFEMLTVAQAEKAEPALRGDAGALEQALRWDETGWPGFAMYYPIFLAAGEAVFYGAAIPREEARAAMTAGIVRSFGPEAEAYGLTVPLPPEQQAAREKQQHLAHCEAMPPDMLSVMVDVQRLRDATLARAVMQALDETGGPVAVITGNGHARRDWGVPVYLDRVAPEVSVFSLGLLEEGGAEASRYDATERFEPAKRDDPCAVFQKG